MRDRFQSAWGFLNIPDELSSPSRANGWVLPIPYEATTCYGAGTREGPNAILAASKQVEVYDHEFGCEPAMRYGVHTLNPLLIVHSSPEDMVRHIEQTVAGIMCGSPSPKVLGVIGGEHSISPGIAQGLARTRKRLVTVHIDAHADMREEYDGSRFSHACAARRILDTCPVFQIGMRNLSEEEHRLCRKNKRVTTVFSEEANDPKGRFLKKLASFVRDRQVFLTIDLDGLDPSIMPAVGTPEPGGLMWERVMDIVRVVCANAEAVPAFDIVELAPIPGLRHPDFLAAKLIYKIFSNLLLPKKNQKRR